VKNSTANSTAKKKVSKLKNDNTLTTWVFLLPYFLLFTVFIVVPIVVAIGLSFTNFNGVQTPQFIGLDNFINLFTQDSEFMQQVLPNTFKFALIVGPGSYILSFLMAWLLAQIPKKPRTVLALMIYSPSLTAGVAMSVLWTVIFSGNSQGYINGMLLKWGFITQPIQFLQSPQYLMNIMILVSLWGSMGVGFLAMLSGILNINPEIYEAAYIDGISNRFQEIVYITVPSMKPQMLFGAVMAIVGTFQGGSIGVQLSGTNPTPNDAGQLISNHIDDYGLLRYELGYAAAISVVLLIIIYILSKVVGRLFRERN
jgi:multiple sugar transport system permease protein